LGRIVDREAVAEQSWQVIFTQAVVRKRTAVTACGFPLCGVLAAPAVMDMVSALTDTEQTQVDAMRKKPKKPPRH
jgi:hypothetical protein